MARRRTSVRAADPRNVFLNIPFDSAYERRFVALVAAIVAIGRKPRCVLELPEVGRGRLSRLVEHLGQCGVSIHDSSRVGTPVRFNMPFGLKRRYRADSVFTPSLFQRVVAAATKLATDAGLLRAK